MRRVPSPGATEAGLRIAHADLGYLLGAASHGGLPAVCFMPYAALVAYETDLFLSRALGSESVLAGTPATAAARMANKIFDDKRSSVEEISSTLGRLAAENEQYFRGGAKRSIARALGIFNPDLSVFVLDGTPLLYGTVIPFQLGLHSLARGNRDDFGPVVGKVAEGLGALAGAFGLRLGEHHGDASLGERLSALDALSTDYNAAAFGGEATPLDSLLLALLMNNAAVGARLAASTCCPSCASAAVKHQFVAGYQTALSLQILVEADLLTAALRGRLRTIADSPDAHFLRGHRRLRNSLVHLGLSDRSAEIVEAADPISALIEADLDMSLGAAAARIGQAIAALDDQLTSWLLADAQAVLDTLQVPE